ncbi:COG3650 family protein [Aurantiacibacter gilvus]|uniref:Lipoprotein n=1 Tax=Aurantiacibacter gilvus TaxID=3139141 RepID=A0ABU9IFP4_9SPHN
MNRAAILAAIPALLTLSACQQGEDAGNVPGDASDTHAFDGIGEHDVVRFTGTEPFWGGQVAGTSLTYSTPENIDGETITVTRFAGRGGLSFSGNLDGRPLDLAITPGDCSDGMSDRSYPFVATLQLGSEQRNGCAWREGIDDLGPQP